MSGLLHAARAVGADVRGIRLATVGMSIGTTCGVRAHAALLDEDLRREGVACSMHWLWRGERSLARSRAEIASWSRDLAAELEHERPAAILLHYSVFSYSHRGMPVFVPGLLRMLRGLRVPMIGMLHEIVYPWTHGGLRGKLWAASQRAVLIDVMRSSAGDIVTAGSREEWLASRRWLPARRVLCAPVFSNLPPPAPAVRVRRARSVLGLFGYSYEGAAIPLMLDALRLLREQGLDVELRLLGAPGAVSEVGETWARAARERGLEQALSFSGKLETQALSNALADCDVLLFADSAGPSSRKGTLAGSLASGRPIVAIDGPNTWRELVAARAAEVVAPSAQAVAVAVAELLADEPARESAGTRARDFYEREMALSRSTEAVLRQLADIIAGPPPAAPAPIAS